MEAPRSSQRQVVRLTLGSTTLGSGVPRRGNVLSRPNRGDEGTRCQRGGNSCADLSYAPPHLRKAKLLGPPTPLRARSMASSCASSYCSGFQDARTPQ